MRKLKPEEIECRVATVSKKGCSLLLYKDARCDMKLLDEEYGTMGWQRHHREIDGNLYCEISVWDKGKECWVSKEDVGTESYTEKEKGQASDSFKRAGFNWGVGRELYTAPFIWINAKDVNIEENKNNGKLTTYDHFTLKDIKYDGDVISELEIVNDKMKRVVYTYGKLTANENEPKPKNKKSTTKTSYKPVLMPTETDKHSNATSAQIEQIKTICKEQGVSIDFIVNTYKKKSIEELSRIQAYSIVSSWEKFKEKYDKEAEDTKKKIEELEEEIGFV